ncbi:MAG: hypothetical protein KC505_07400 [Myxococcales bacterium]|nr:hypothetical protein [Myxococcales bacterium]USN50630.1 MAG: hypothetical protein H6731_10265 [Myxococcales bacterium]
MNIYLQFKLVIYSFLFFLSLSLGALDLSSIACFFAGVGVTTAGIGISAACGCGVNTCTNPPGHESRGYEYCCDSVNRVKILLRGNSELVSAINQQNRDSILEEIEFAEELPPNSVTDSYYLKMTTDKEYLTTKKSLFTKDSVESIDLIYLNNLYGGSSCYKPLNLTAFFGYDDNPWVKKYVTKDLENVVRWLATQDLEKDETYIRKILSLKTNKICNKARAYNFIGNSNDPVILQIWLTERLLWSCECLKAGKILDITQLHTSDD